MENFSDIETRGKGRPSVLPKSMYQLFKNDYPNATDRTVMNRFYTWKGAQALLDDGGDAPTDDLFLYFFEMGGNGTFESYKRKTILTELGRVEDEDVIRDLAAHISENKHNTKDAIAIIRAVRLGKQPPGDRLQLAKTILKAIGEYENTHENVSPDMIKGALSAVEDVVSETQDEVVA